jgi:hypothetical protein
MAPTFPLLATLLLSATFVASAQPLQPARISLIAATNYVQALRARGGPVRTEEVVIATAKACNGLTELVRDEAFRQRIIVTTDAAREHAEAASAIRGSLAAFVNEFMAPEIQLLEHAGLDSTAVIQIAKDAIELKSYAYLGKYGKDTVEKYLKDLEVFRLEVCAAAQKAVVIKAKSDKEALDRVAYGVSGAAVIFVNTAAAKPTAMLSTLSYDLGFDLLRASPK